MFFAGLIHHFLVIKLNLLPFLAKPIDFYKNIFGNKKTFRGFFVMTFLSGLFFWIFEIFIDFEANISSFFCGCLLGFGYSLSELPNSFIKRRLGVLPSQKPKKFLLKLFFEIIDHSDSIIGAILFLHLFYDPSFELIIKLFLIGFLLHLVVDFILHKFGYKRSKTKKSPKQ